MSTRSKIKCLRILLELSLLRVILSETCTLYTLNNVHNLGSISTYSDKSAATNCRANGGNGYCDNDLNREECAWDGGDCCACTCVDGEFTCGSNGYYCLDSTVRVLAEPVTDAFPPTPTWITSPPAEEIPTTAFLTPTTMSNEGESRWQARHLQLEPTPGPSLKPISSEETPAERPTVSPTPEILDTVTATSSATVAFAGGSVVAAGLGGLVGGTGSSVGTGASSVMGLGFEHIVTNIQTGTETVVKGISLRQPSIALGFIMISQLQFLGALSLVNYNTTQEPLLKDFVGRFRLANLRWPFPSKNFTEDMTACTSSSDAEYESTLEFVGNLILFLGGIVCIFLVHVAVASGMEAFMTLKRQAIDLIKMANNQGIPVSNLPSIVLKKNSGERSAVLTDAQDIEYIGGSCDGSEAGYEEKTANGRQDDLVECRDNSSSVWFHFPHLELVFLFFAFQGAVTTEARVFRHAGLNCPSVLFVAIAYLVLYPTLMVAIVSRAILVRVLPESLIEFRYFPSDAEDGSNWLSRVQNGWKEERSLLAWADRGRWHTVETSDEEQWREGNWFRIGCEPLFVDFTKSGTWFVIFSLFKSAGIACVGALVDDSIWQLLLFCIFQTVSLSVLVVLKPFANTIINAMAIVSAAVDALTTGLMAASEMGWLNSTTMGSIVVYIQLVVLVVVAIPSYVDSTVGIAGLIWRKIQHARDTSRNAQNEANEANRQIRAFTRLYIRRMWARKWCGMFRHNISACAKDARSVIRKPRERHTGAETSHPPALRSNIYQDGGHPGGPRRNTGLQPPPKNYSQEMGVGTTDRGRALEAAPEIRKHSERRLDPSILPRRGYIRIGPGSEYSSESTISSESTSDKVKDSSNEPTSRPDDNNHTGVPEVSRAIFAKAARAGGDRARRGVSPLRGTFKGVMVPNDPLRLRTFDQALVWEEQSPTVVGTSEHRDDGKTGKLATEKPATEIRRRQWDLDSPKKAEGGEDSDRATGFRLEKEQCDEAVVMRTDSVDSLEATVEVQELPENQLLPIHFVPGGEPLPKVTLSPDSTIVKEEHELFVSGASESDDFLESETTEGLSNSAEIPDRSVRVTQDVSLLSDASDGAVMSTDLPRHRSFDGGQHSDKKLRPAVRLTTNTDRTSTGKRASAVPKNSVAFKGYFWSLRGFARPTAKDCPHRTAGFIPQPDVCGKGYDVMNANQESFGVSPSDHIEDLEHTREAFMSPALSDGKRLTQKTSSLLGAPRGALGWIDLPRRRTFDPEMHVGEQASYGEGTNEIESRGVPRGSLDWIDLPRRRTFDPKLRVGEQACVGEGTNGIESLDVPRGALDWIDLPRRRTIDPKLHVGVQACYGEGTNEIENRESVSENAYAKMPRSIRTRWSLGSVSDMKVDDNPRRKKGFQLELGGGHEQADARRGGFASPRENKSIPAIPLGCQQVRSAPEDNILPVKELIIGPHVEKIQQLSETEPRANNRVWSSNVIRNVFNTTAPVPVDIPRRSSVSCRVDGNTESIQKQVHRFGDIDQGRPSCGPESLNESVHIDNRPGIHDVPQHLSFPLSQPPTPLSENKAEGTDIVFGAIPTPKEENCQIKTKSELDERLDHDTNAMGDVHGFRWRRSSTTPVAMDLPRPFAANPTDIRGLWRDNDGDTLITNGGDHENAMNTLQPEVWSVNAQTNGVGSSSSDGARHRLVNQLKISGTSRMVGTGVDSGAFAALDVYNPITPTSKDEPEEYQPSGDPATKAQERKPRVTGVFKSKVPSVLDLPRRKDSYDLSIEKTPLDSAKEKEKDTTNTQGTQDRVHTEAVTHLASGNASSTRSTSGLTPGRVKKTAGGRYTRLPTIFENEALC